MQISSAYLAVINKSVTDSDPGRTTLKILTTNLFFYNRDYINLISVITFSDAPVLCCDKIICLLSIRL